MCTSSKKQIAYMLAKE